MTLIEGVGDEVVQFLGVLLVAVVGLFAWWSTNARPGRYRTVVVMRTRPHHPVTVSFRSRPNFMITNNQASSSTSTTEPTSDTVAVSPEAVEERDTSRVIPLQEMDSIIDADMAMMNNHRLHFYRRLDAPGSVQGITDSASEESETQEEAEPASNDQMREMDSIVSAMEADVTAGCDFFTRPSETKPNSTDKKSDKNNEDSSPSTASNVNKTEAEAQNSADNESGVDSANQGDSESPADTDRPDGERQADAGNATAGNDEGHRILIKLKYLNDTLKEVEGSLDELLKDFKWRHFGAELSAEARVRLIFNGRVLADDASTLRACGLHHRAVVHALVHPKRAPAQQQHGIPEEDVGNAHELVTEGAHQERAWDIENILMTLVSVALTIVWFFRCEYSNMFTASASVALFGLTVFYSVAIFGLYLSDTFHIDRRPAQPVPDN